MAEGLAAGAVVVRPRLPGVLVGVACCVVGSWMALAGARKGSVIAGAVLAAAGPAGFWYWSRVREARFDGQGIHLRGLGLSIAVPWTGVEYVRSERIGPTTFMITKTTHGPPMPLLSPFRRRFAAQLGVDDPHRLLVVRTVDFTGGPAAFGDALSVHAPASVPVDWRDTP